MAPDTSTTLLRDIASDAGNPRWGEFVTRYRPMLTAYMSRRFPSLSADDLVQETFVAVAKALPDYRYAPDENGHFRNFLIGILRHKALNELKRTQRHEEILQQYAEERPKGSGTERDDEQSSRETLYEIALQQLLANPDVSERDKQILIRTAIRCESPVAVADSLAVTRDVVDQVKRRMVVRLRTAIENLKRADEDQR